MRGEFFVDSSGPNGSTFGTFSLEAGAPASEGVHEDNTPPRYMRVTIQGGDLEGASDFEYPTGGSVKSLARLDVGTARRDRPIFLGRETWSGHAGSLVLAPSYPLGGFHGNHIAFRWTSGQSDYVVSLHAWKPLAEARNALRSIVESIPD